MGDVEVDEETPVVDLAEAHHLAAEPVSVVELVGVAVQVVLEHASVHNRALGQDAHAAA